MNQDRFLFGTLLLGLLTFLAFVGSVVYFELRSEPRIEASGDGPDVLGTPPKAADVLMLIVSDNGTRVCAKNGEFVPCPDRSSKEALDSTAPCDFTDRKELQQAMISCTKRGSTSVSKHMIDRGQCFFFDCADGKR